MFQPISPSDFIKYMYNFVYVYFEKNIYEKSLNKVQRNCGFVASITSKLYQRWQIRVEIYDLVRMNIYLTGSCKGIHKLHFIER
jgi:hypothetical protein